MNISVPLPLLLVVLSSGLLVFGIYAWIRAIQQSAQRISVAAISLETAVTDCAAAAKQVYSLLAPASAVVQANMASLPKLLEAVAKVGQAQLEFMQAHRAAALEKQRNPFGRPNNPLPPRDATAANLEYDVDRMIRSEGITREEALMRLNGANASSVWDGNTVFEGWK